MAVLVGTHRSSIFCLLLASTCSFTSNTLSTKIRHIYTMYRNSIIFAMLALALYGIYFVHDCLVPRSRAEGLERISCKSVVSTIFNYEYQLCDGTWGAMFASPQPLCGMAVGAIPESLTCAVATDISNVHGINWVTMSKSQVLVLNSIVLYPIPDSTVRWNLHYLFGPN